MRSVLITGGLGFIGSHLADDFQSRGWQVAIVDDRRSAVEGWSPDPSMHVIDASVEEFCSRCEIPDSLVIHAASPVGPAGILSHAGHIIPQIVEPTVAVVDACAQMRVPLIHISTSEVYNASGINSEADDLIAPATPSVRGEYAVGKIAAEYIVRQRSRLELLPSIVIRPFNIAGARQPREKGFVVPTFVEQALASEPLTVFGKGDQRRSFMSVKDFCRFVQVVSQDFPLSGQVLNAGNPKNVTTVEALARRVIQRVGTGTFRQSAPIEYVDGKDIHGPEWREAAGYHKVPDIERSKLIGWKPTDNLDAIIDATAAELQPLEAAA